jgi:hypothetical protein
MVIGLYRLQSINANFGGQIVVKFKVNPNYNLYHPRLTQKPR